MIRRTCVLAAVIGVFLQGTDGGHLLLVEHTMCPEHGELIHARGDVEHPVSTKALYEGRAFETPADHGIVGGCEHCEHASDRRDAVTKVSQTDQLAPLVLASTVEAPFIRALAERAALFRIAPKNSPPA